MDEARRIRIGILGVLVGLLAVAAGVAIAHFTVLAATDPVTRAPILPAVPRGWQFRTLGQIIALVGSQVAVAAFVYAWILDRPLTWARAGTAAFLAWFELILVFGIIPSEWLNLAQTDLEWSQRIVFTIPPWLVLNNEVAVSYAAVKDTVSTGWNAVALAALIVLTYRIQERAKHPPPAPPPPTSPYGRPLVRSD